MVKRSYSWQGKRGTNGCTAFFGGDGWRLQLDIGENNSLVQ